MPKINKVHFNWVDYDIGDKNIHDLTEKAVLDLNDEFNIADSENIRQNKKIKYWNICGELVLQSDIVAGENLWAGDVVIVSNNKRMKATISNQWPIPKQAYIVREQTVAWNKVFLNFAGISNLFSWLTVWAKYYISNTAGVLTTSQLWGFLVWTAIATDKLLLHNSYKALISWDNYQLYYLEHSWYRTNTTYTQVWSYTAQENMWVRFKATLARGTGSASGFAHVSLYLNWNLLQTRDNSNRSTPLAISYDFNCSAWDIISFWERCDGQSILVYFNDIYITADLIDKYF